MPVTVRKRPLPPGIHDMGPDRRRSTTQPATYRPERLASLIPIPQLLTLNIRHPLHKHTSIETSFSAGCCCPAERKDALRTNVPRLDISRGPSVWCTEVRRLTFIGGRCHMSRVANSTIEAIHLLITDHLKPGDQLPSEQDLVRQIGVSRATVRDALTRLAAEGVVQRRWGVGTFVTQPSPRTASGILSLRPGIPGLLATTGGTPSVHRFKAAEASSDPELFPDFPETPTLSLLRVFALDGVPAIAIQDRLVCEFGRGRIDPLPLESVDTLVPDVLERVGIDFSSLEVEMWTAQLDKAGRETFDLTRSEPVIETKGVGSDADGRRILVSRGTYRTSVVHLSLTIA